MAEERIVEGYGCICGFTTQDKKEFNSHLIFSGKRDGKGIHKSLGRVDMQTGAVITPPWAERSLEDREKTTYAGLRGAADNGDTETDKTEDKTEKTGDKTEKGDKTDKGGNGHKVEKREPSIAHTSILGDAQQIRVVPRIFTMDYTLIMRAAQDAAAKFWGWRADMPIGNFLDTCLYLFFQEKGITLCGYIVDDSLLEKEAQDAG